MGAGGTGPQTLENVAKINQNRVENGPENRPKVRKRFRKQ